ncbi:ABC-2 type transporter [delta proteobacterium NaphS2]|nr:ABC-2 type transporter [delta proteobacterium NaphS2]
MKDDPRKERPLGSSRLRVRALVRKEALQIIRDPSSIAIAFLLPMVLLFLFGYGVSLDAKNVPMALVVEKPSPLTQSFTAAFAHSPYFTAKHFRFVQEAEQAMMERNVKGIVWLRENSTETELSKGNAPIGVLVDGVDANNARIIEGYLQGIWANWLEKFALSKGKKVTIPVVMEERIWFNQEVRSRNFLVPGLIAVIMTLIGALLTAMVVAREWERGTMEALMATPVRAGEIIMGKLIPYFLLGMGGMALSVAMAVWLFQVPLRGSLLALFGASALFLVVALGMGLMISTVAKDQFVAGQIAIIATFLPAFILSGFIFDIGSMPPVIQGITHIIAARYFVAILQTLFMAGDVWSLILMNALALMVMAVIFLVLVRKRTGKRLE